MEVNDGDKLVVRVWRWDAERLLVDTDIHYDDCRDDEPPAYAISVFALEKVPGESVDDLQARLCLQVSQHRRGKWAAVTTASRLAEAGFSDLRLSEPPPDHYDVHLGTVRETLDVDRLSAVFGEHQRRRLPDCRTSS